MSTLTAPLESTALMATLESVAPEAPTACTEWTAHDLAAHIAAGAQETAELLEDRLAGHPARATRAFDEREAPFVAMPDPELRQAMADQSRRKVAATAAFPSSGTMPPSGSPAATSPQPN